MNELTLPERNRLTECETIIEKGLQTFVEVGIALAEIRESRLYRLTHGTFEEYCGERWQIGRRQADRLIAGAETAEILRPFGLVPQSESVARPLTKLEPEQQPTVWREAVATAPNGQDGPADQRRNC